jgi:hypothetical protein
MISGPKPSGRICRDGNRYPFLRTYRTRIKEGIIESPFFLKNLIRQSMNASLLLRGGAYLSLMSVGFASRIVQALWMNTADFLLLLSDALPNNPPIADAAVTLAAAKAAAEAGEWRIREAAQQALRVVIEKRPDLADAALAAAKSAVMDTHDSVREAARLALEVIVRKRPDLADTALTTAVAKAAAANGHWDVRQAAQQTLGLILDKNPELAEAALAVTRATVIKGNEGDDETREAAYQTLEMIVKKRPDLADGVLTMTVAKVAVAELEWYVRKAALQALGTILDKRPDLAEAALAAVKAAAARETAGAGKATQQILDIILINRPDLR